MECQKALVEQKEIEEREDDISTTVNFKHVSMDGDLLSRISAKGGKKGKKNMQDQEIIQPLM